MGKAVATRCETRSSHLKRLVEGLMSGGHGSRSQDCYVIATQCRACHCPDIRHRKFVESFGSQDLRVSEEPEIDFEPNQRAGKEEIGGQPPSAEPAHRQMQRIHRLVKDVYIHPASAGQGPAVI